MSDPVMAAIASARESTDHLDPSAQAASLVRAAYEVFKDADVEHDDAVATIVEIFDEQEAT